MATTKPRPKVKPVTTLKAKGIAPIKVTPPKLAVKIKKKNPAKTASQAKAIKKTNKSNLKAELKKAKMSKRLAKTERKGKKRIAKANSKVVLGQLTSNKVTEIKGKIKKTKAVNKLSKKLTNNPTGKSRLSMIAAKAKNAPKKIAKKVAKKVSGGIRNLAKSLRKKK